MNTETANECKKLNNLHLLNFADLIERTYES
jgi:hypothetical protein